MTMRSRCPICKGAGKLTFPVRLPLATADFRGGGSADDVRPLPDHRTYPCPECAPAIDPAKVMIVGAADTISHEVQHRAGERYIQHMTEDLYHGLAIHMLRNKMVRVTRREIDPSKSEIRGEIGVVMPSVVKTIEDRIEERGAEIAKAAIEDVVALCKRRQSCSPFVDLEGTIREIRSALETVLRARKREEV